MQNARFEKSPFYKGYRGCGKLLDVLDFKRYATRIPMICIGHFQRNLGMSFSLRVPTSGVAVSEYFEMMLASIAKYLLSDIARQRDILATVQHWIMATVTQKV